MCGPCHTALPTSAVQNDSCIGDGNHCLLCPCARSSPLLLSDMLLAPPLTALWLPNKRTAKPQVGQSTRPGPPKMTEANWASYISPRTQRNSQLTLGTDAKSCIENCRKWRDLVSMMGHMQGEVTEIMRKPRGEWNRQANKQELLGERTSLQGCLVPSSFAAPDPFPAPVHMCPCSKLSTTAGAMSVCCSPVYPFFDYLHFGA